MKNAKENNVGICTICSNRFSYDSTVSKGKFCSKNCYYRYKKNKMRKMRSSRGFWKRVTDFIASLFT